MMSHTVKDMMFDSTASSSFDKKLKKTQKNRDFLAHVLLLNMKPK